MPFADYKDFDDCVSKNQDKDNPEAYCGSIKAKVEEGEDVTETVPKKMRIEGPVSDQQVINAYNLKGKEAKKVKSGLPETAGLRYMKPHEGLKIVEKDDK